MIKFVDAICKHRNQLRNHCERCRSSVEVRSSLSKDFEIPEGGIEECPFGVTTKQARQIIKPDRVIVLSLESRQDRWDAFTTSCKRSKYLSIWKIERYLARPPSEMIVPAHWKKESPTHYATRVDHLNMIERSYVAGHKHVLIFEDDAIIQPCFDRAYETACAELPEGWLGLWLTSDGHQRSPENFSENLNRSTSQVFLHAYMLSRSGMHRTYSHVLDRPAQIIDGATQDLMSSEPRFYSTKQNAVIQIGLRGSSLPRSDFYNRKANNVIIPPYHGEFGCRLLRHVRYVHELKADAKIVCCRRGEELLYPSANGFEYDWQEVGIDASRVGDGPPGKAPACPGYKAIVPRYDSYGAWSKFTPTAAHHLKAVDVVLGVRKREFEPDRNWPYWIWLAEQFRAIGLTVGVAGRADSSADVGADTRAWHHPEGHTAGSVDLLRHCRLYVGTDTGTTHLAAMCDTPTIAFRLAGNGPDFMQFAQAMTTSLFERLPDTSWNQPDAILAASLAGLRSLK